MAENMGVDTIPANSVRGLTEEYVDMWVHASTSWSLSEAAEAICHSLFSFFLVSLVQFTDELRDLGPCPWQEPAQKRFQGNQSSRVQRDEAQHTVSAE